jgi:ketosteroid isomerase-like protein
VSAENMEVARRALEAIARRDRTAFLAVHDEDFELVPIRNWPEPGVRGNEAAWERYLKTFSAFERFPIEDGEIIDPRADKVLLHYRFDLSGRGSGAGVEFAYWNVVTVRQGRILRSQWFEDRAEAVEAAGLSE